MPQCISPEDSQSDPLGYVCVGIIVGAHGIRGLARVKSFTEDPQAIESYGVLTDQNGERTFSLSILQTTKGVLLCQIEGCTDRSSVEALRGQKLYVPRDSLPFLEEEDAFYHTDLIGMSAFNSDGTSVGTVTALFDFGAGDVMEIKNHTGASFFVPFTRQVVPVVDIKKRRVVLDQDALSVHEASLENPTKQAPALHKKSSRPSSSQKNTDE